MRKLLHEYSAKWNVLQSTGDCITTCDERSDTASLVNHGISMREPDPFWNGAYRLKIISTPPRAWCTV